MALHIIMFRSYDNSCVREQDSQASNWEECSSNHGSHAHASRQRRRRSKRPVTQKHTTQRVEYAPGKGMVMWMPACATQTYHLLPQRSLATEVFPLHSSSPCLVRSIRKTTCICTPFSPAMKSRAQHWLGALLYSCTSCHCINTYGILLLM